MRAAWLMGLVLMGAASGAAAQSATSAWTLFAAEDPAKAAPEQRGRVLFQNACSACHGNGMERPGTRSLEIKYAGAKPGLLEERRDLTPEFVLFYIRNGFGMMPFFRKTELSDADADAIAAYLSRKKR